jgi:hypothetical protein
MARESKRAVQAGVPDMLFLLGDSNGDDSLDESEVRELFSGKLFASALSDILWAIMSRDSNKSHSLDLQGKPFS